MVDVVADPFGVQPAAASWLLAPPSATPLAPAGAPVAPATTPLMKAAVDPSSAAASWFAGITPGRDSSGPVVLDVLHPEVKKAMVGLRDVIGPYTVTSAAGGHHSNGSQHYEDNAIDVSIAGKSPEELAKMVTAARAQGFTGIGLANDHLHLDMRPGGPVVFADSSGGRYVPPTEWAGKPLEEWQRTLGGGGGGGTQIASSGSGAAPRGDFYSALKQIESSGQNIFSKVDPDVAGPGSRSQGFFQINTPTWRDFAPKEVLAKYPNAMAAPEEVQRAVVANIPFGRFGPRTVRMLQEQYGFGDEAKGMTVGQLAAKYGGQGGGGQGGGSVAGSTGGTGTNPTALFAQQMKLTLLRNLFPKHDIQQVEYDPFKLMPKPAERVDVNQGVG